MREGIAPAWTRRCGGLAVLAGSGWLIAGLVTGGHHVLASLSVAAAGLLARGWAKDAARGQVRYGWTQLLLRAGTIALAAGIGLLIYDWVGGTGRLLLALVLLYGGALLVAASSGVALLVADGAIAALLLTGSVSVALGAALLVVHWTGGHAAVGAALAVGCAGAAVLSAVARWDTPARGSARYHRVLLRDGVPARGEVLTVQAADGEARGPAGPWLRLRLRVSPDGDAAPAPYEAETLMPFRDREPPAVGDVVPVLYHPHVNDRVTLAGTPPF